MLPEAIIAEASARGLTIACAESITGGALCSALIAVPGASVVVAGGVVAYTVEAKVDVLGVDAGVIESFGVVSEQVALAMARRVRELYRADVGVATTGAAGPEGHGGKAAGTVCVASVGPMGEGFASAIHEGDRTAVREAAVADALAILVRRVRETAHNA